MTTYEMHRLFEYQLNKIASNNYTKFTPHEIDTFLNRAQSALVKKKITSFASDPQKRGAVINMVSIADELRNLVVKNKKLLVHTPQEGSTVDDYLYEPRMSYAVLPEDYLYYGNARADIDYVKLDNRNCDVNLSKSYICNDQNHAEYIAVVPFVAQLTNICTQNAIDFKLVFKNVRRADGTYADVAVFDYAQWNTTNGIEPYLSLQEQGDKAKLINIALEYMNRFNSPSELINADPTNLQYVESSNDLTVFKVYWEKYNNQFYQNCFVFVTNQKIDISIAGTPSTYEPDNTYNFAPTDPKGITVELVGTGNTTLFSGKFRQITRCRQALNVTAPQVINKFYSPVRLTDIRFAYTDMLGNTFVGSTKERPMGILGDDKVFIYTDNSFTVNRLYLDYWKTPRQISLSHGFNPEFP